MTLPTYREVAQRADIPLEEWDADKRTTRSGIKRLLMQRAPEPSRLLSVNSHIVRRPDWLRAWERITWVRQTARTKVRVVLPPELWQEEKAWMLARLASDRTAGLEKQRAAARRWACQ